MRTFLKADFSHAELEHVGGVGCWTDYFTGLSFRVLGEASREDSTIFDLGSFIKGGREQN